MLAEAQEFERRARETFAESPYEVTSTHEGFRVDLQIADARWYEFFAQAGLTSAWRHDVKITTEGFSITDRRTQMRWRAGVPEVDWSRVGTVGTQLGTTTERTWAFDEQGRFRRVVDYSFNPAESRRALRDIGDHLGLRYRMNAHARMGLAFGIAGGAVAVLALVTVGILALAGVFG